ncbi:MAG: hypothetical protein V1704_04635 [Candidatus Vogelbacteria bacterium]
MIFTFLRRQLMDGVMDKMKVEELGEQEKLRVLDYFLHEALRRAGNLRREEDPVLKEIGGEVYTILTTTIRAVGLAEERLK